MEVNKEEAIRCLSISSRHRSNSNLPSALKFARKSVSLYSTPEGEAMVIAIEREIESGGSSSTPPSTGTSTPQAQANGTSTPPSQGKTSGVEEHITSAHSRPGHSSSTTTTKKPETTSHPGAGTTKKSYTAKQLEVVKRVKSCKHHQYYEILSVEKSCTENDVKKAYKKLALALHPDKNNAPGADEAFKMVSKAFQVLSDTHMRAAFDSNPTYDPTQRNPGPSGGGGGMRGFGGGGGPGMYQSEINPEDLFNMFFGGGGGGGGFGGSPFGQANVFTFGGPGGFQAHYGGRPRRPTQGHGQQAGEASSPVVALLPIIILFLFAMVSIIPSLFSNQQPDPSYGFEKSVKLNLNRETSNWKVPYWVNNQEWQNSDIYQSVPDNRKGKANEGIYSTKLRGFERGVENVYARRLQNECQYFLDRRQQSINENSGFFGIGANTDKLKEIRSQKSPACDQLRKWGFQVNQGTW
ncbi:uncharacterized protein I303_106823 [Kwoniella dejecticola CBS 10117]|uniref:Endoplasmic reticulum protein n=1 Tax=Kwoniella dejecticola CBS 10117 TaxID=1296121 RepID=A0A1A5ZTQ0_9TREE|nr:endoplasmic reticulum protein [Kwoniella dejecticola CBS 10117]OBR81150.1 endoplasmic reticulum protein [Kwoniella dejecticola CBS 10117]